MLGSLISLLPSGNKRHPIAYYRMLDTLTERMNIARNRFVSTPLARTSGVELLRWMILNFNTAEASSYTDDTSLFTELVEGYQDEFRSAFDPVWTKSISYGKFFRNKGGVHPSEFLLNCSLSNPAVDLPFGESWPSWHGIRAVEIVYHNSLELPIDLWTGYVTFLNKPPTFAVISINVPVLLMKWIKYSSYCKEQGVEADELEFIKEEEYNQFFYDLLDIWLTNLITLAVSRTDLTENKLCEEVFVPSYITSDTMVKMGVSALVEQIKFLKDRAIRMQDFIDTMWFAGEQSIRDRMISTESKFVLPETRQYRFLEIAKSLPYLRMISSIIDNDPDNPRYNPLIRKTYNLYVKNIKFASLPNLQYSSSLKTFVSLCCNEFDKLFEWKINAPTEITA